MVMHTKFTNTLWSESDGTITTLDGSRLGKLVTFTFTPQLLHSHTRVDIEAVWKAPSSIVLTWAVAPFGHSQPAPWCWPPQRPSLASCLPTIPLSTSLVRAESDGSLTQAPFCLLSKSLKRLQITVTASLGNPCDIIGTRQSMVISIWLRDCQCDSVKVT